MGLYSGLFGQMRDHYDQPQFTGMDAGSFQGGDLRGLMSLVNSFRDSGMTPQAPNTSLPQTRTFAGFLGSGGLQPVGSFSQSAMNLAKQPPNSQFLNPGAAWGGRQANTQPAHIAPPPRFPGLFGGAR